MQVFNTVLPVFILIALGFALKRSGFLSEPLIAGTNKLVYFIGLPSLLFLKMAQSTADFTGRGDLILALILTMAVLSALAWLFACWSRLARRDRGTFAQAALRSNAAFVGLPIIAFATGSSIDSISPMVILLLTLIVILNNLLAVGLLLLSTEQKSGAQMVASVVIKTLLNPLLLASFFGLVYSLFAPALPDAISRTMTALGSMSLPLALICIGATINLQHIRHRARTLWTAALIKTALAPLLAALFAMILGLDPDETLPLVIFMAAPTAAASYVLVDQIGGDRELAAGAVALSTVLSFASLSIVVALF